MSFRSKICFLAAVSLLTCVAPEVRAAKDASRAEISSAKLLDGIYLVLRDANTADKLEPITKKELVLLNDFRFFEPAERDKPDYLVINRKDFIPIVLQNEPVKDKDSKGKSKLLLQLSKKQIIPLEKFTRKNCGRTVAIVIDSQVVTAHKIREPITGGRMQITRCSDNGCDVLYSKLQGDSK